MIQCVAVYTDTRVTVTAHNIIGSLKLKTKQNHVLTSVWYPHTTLDGLRINRKKVTTPKNLSAWYHIGRTCQPFDCIISSKLYCIRWNHFEGDCERIMTVLRRRFSLSLELWSDCSCHSHAFIKHTTSDRAYGQMQRFWLHTSDVNDANSSLSVHLNASIAIYSSDSKCKRLKIRWTLRGERTT